MSGTPGSMRELEDPVAWLEAHGAQRDVLDGLRDLAGGDAAPRARWETLWRECPRGDWMLGIAAKLGVDRRPLVLAAVACAEGVLDQAESPRARELLDAARSWARGEATDADVAARTRALDAEPARGPAEDAAHRAALAVGYGVEDPAVLAAAASSAAEATLFATLDCGMPLVLGYAHAKTAEAVRAAVRFEMLMAQLEPTSHEDAANRP